MGHRGVEQHLVGGIGQRGVEVGRALDTVLARERCEAIGVAADEEHARHHPVGADGKAALGADRRQRILEMLGRADPAGGAVQDDADGSGGHADSGAGGRMQHAL